jgi:hypothetical protein
MRTLVERYCFIYGCVASAGALVWYLAALAGRAELPDSVWVAEGLALIHGITMVITFHRRPYRSPWAPVLQITPKRIRTAKVVLGTAAANFLFCLVLAISEHRTVSERALSMLLASIMLLNTVYVAIHWAFRPQNVFPRQFLDFMSSPLLYFFLRQRLEHEHLRVERQRRRFEEQDKGRSEKDSAP